MIPSTLSLRWSQPSPADDLALHDDEAQLWLASLSVAAQVVEQCWSVLSADERRRAQRFHFARDRRRFVVGRAALRTLLSDYTGLPAAALRFHYGPHGKPALASEQNHRGVYFNASGSDDQALYAFTCRGEIGVDVERVRPLPEWREIARMAGLDQVKTSAEFFPAWARHEARLKAAGLGLGQPLPENQPSSDAVCDLHLEPGWAGAVVLPEGVRRVTGWRWTDYLAFAAVRS